MAEMLSFVGLSALRRAFSEMPEKADRASRGAVMRATSEMKTLARANAPVGPSGKRAEGGQDRHPGKLRRSIRYTPARRLGPAVWQSYVRSGLPYSPKEEQRERFMHRAYDQVEARLPRIYADAWGRAVGTL